jgi:UDP-N-acetyl-D-galactosamine dehydrogenase
MNLSNVRISVIGLGYVGLPLAVEFGKKYPTVGFDIDSNRISELSQGIDYTKEVNEQGFKSAIHLRFTNDVGEIRGANIFIITVPTPVDEFNSPDLTLLLKATETVAANLTTGDIVVYESTVFPGATEEYCVPVLENKSGLKFNKDFFCGYSPERINPGDKNYRLTSIRKITSGSTSEVAEHIDNLYKSIIVAGTYKAPNIKVAEAAKVIENTQRDINIAFMNELSKIFNRLGIDTLEVLAAAETKWNFLSFKPGLVGGHCIGVDPYYLAQKAQLVGYHPEIILAGRRINDGMGEYIGSEVVRLLIESNKAVYKAKVLILGITFKENVPDIRNSKVIDIYNCLRKFSLDVDVTDMHANKDQVLQEYNINLLSFSEVNWEFYSAVVLAVAHDDFRIVDVSALKSYGCIIYDVKGFFSKSDINGRL